MLSESQREVFDRLLDAEVAALPGEVAALLEEVPLIVEDEPSAVLLEEMGMAGGGGAGERLLCGLHAGVSLDNLKADLAGGRGVPLPDRMMLFREPIMRVAGFPPHAPPRVQRARLARLREQIHITLLHEIGHHFGLDEGELEGLGYG